VPTFIVGYDHFFFSRLCSEAAGKEGQSIVIQARAFQRVAGIKYADPNFHSATILTGTGHVRVYNRLPVPLENLTLQLRNTASGDMIINSPRISRINAYDSVTVSVALDGKQIPQNNQWLISGSTPGSGTTAVRISSDQAVDVLTQFDEVRVSAIEARFPAIDLKSEKSLELPREVAINLKSWHCRRERLKSPWIIELPLLPPACHAV